MTDYPELMCCICQERFTEDTDIRLVKCGHCFCHSCITQWWQSRQPHRERVPDGSGGWVAPTVFTPVTCPTCRQVVLHSPADLAALPKVYSMNEALAAVRRYEESVVGKDQELRRVQEAMKVSEEAYRRLLEETRCLAEPEGFVALEASYSHTPEDLRRPTHAVPFELTPEDFVRSFTQHWNAKMGGGPDEARTHLENICALYVPYFVYTVEMDVSTKSMSCVSRGRNTTMERLDERLITDPMRLASGGTASNWEKAFANQSAIVLFTAHTSEDAFPTAAPDDDHAVGTNVTTLTRRILVRPACHLAESKLFDVFPMVHSVPHAVSLTGLTPDPFSLQLAPDSDFDDNGVVMVRRGGPRVEVCLGRAAEIAKGAEEVQAVLPTRCCRETWCKYAWPEFLHSVVHKQCDSILRGASSSDLQVLQIVVKATVREVRAETMWMPFYTAQVVCGNNGKGALLRDILCKGSSGCFKIL